MKTEDLQAKVLHYTERQNFIQGIRVKSLLQGFGFTSALGETRSTLLFVDTRNAHERTHAYYWVFRIRLLRMLWSSRCCDIPIFSLL